MLRSYRSVKTGRRLACRLTCFSSTQSSTRQTGKQISGTIRLKPLVMALIDSQLEALKGCGGAAGSTWEGERPEKQKAPISRGFLL